MRQTCRQLAYILIASQVLMVAACAGTERIPAPEAPTIPARMAPPAMPPAVLGIPMEKMAAVPGAIRVPERERRGQSEYRVVDEDRVYSVSVGVGGGTEGPQQVAVELPPGEHINAIHWANPTLMSIKAGRVGSVRGGRAVVIIKPLSGVAPRTEDVSILTTERHIRVNVHVKQGRANNSTLKLRGNPNQSDVIKSMGRDFSAEALCNDNNFQWNKNPWWAPMKVCALATPEGTYQTLIFLPRNIQKMPAPIAYSTFGDGEARPEIINFRTGEDRVMRIDGVWSVIRLNGDGGSVDIHRGASR